MAAACATKKKEVKWLANIVLVFLVSFSSNIYYCGIMVIMLLQLVGRRVLLYISAHAHSSLCPEARDHHHVLKRLSPFSKVYFHIGVRYS
jgi:uncharacterized membrane protein (DUF4010 family)